MNQELKIGPCAIIYDGEFLGVCGDGLDFKVDAASQPATSAQSYSQPMDYTLTRLKVTVNASICRISRAMGMLFDQNKRLTLGALGHRLSEKRKALQLIPLNPEDSAGYLIPCAAPNFSFQYRFRSDSPHSLMISFDILPDADGILVENIAVTAAERAMIPVVALIDAVALENTLTGYLGDLLELEPGIDIFTGEIPEEKYGCVVVVEGQSGGRLLEFEQFQASVEFYHPERTRVMASMAELAAILPLYGLEFARSIQVASQDYPASAERDNTSYFRGKVTLSIII